MNHAPEGEFSGAKVAVLWRGAVLTILRDDVTTIPFPGHWDFPGGGREGTESPEACVFREAKEELSLQLSEADVVWRRSFGGVLKGQRRTWFFVARPAHLDLSLLRLGDEGQTWCAMALSEFMAHERGVPHLQDRLSHYLCEGATP